MNSMFKTIKLNIQRFNEPPAPTPTPNPNPTPAPVQVQGEVFSKEYVESLRGEAANHRTEKQKYKAQLRSLMGLAPDAELNETMITNFQKEQAQAQKEALKVANARLLTAEIKSLDGYNAKLVEKLLDKSKVTIADDGTVTGLAEAVAELEKEFPEIKTVSVGTGGANPAGGGGTTQTELERLQEAWSKATDNATRIMINNQIHALQNKK